MKLCSYEEYEDRRQREKGYKRKYYLRNIELVKQKAKLWKKNNPEKAKSISIKYSLSNKGYERKKQWAIDNPEKIKQKQKKWLLNHPEKRKEIERKRDLNRLEKILILSKIAKEANPEAMARCPLNNQ